MTRFEKLVLALLLLTFAGRLQADPAVEFSGQRPRNNLVTDLLEVAGIDGATNRFTFERATPGWVFVAADCQGQGEVSIELDPEAARQGQVACSAKAPGKLEAMRNIAAGRHTLRVTCRDGARVDRLAVRATVELIHCGLGFNSAIQGYGAYDLEFLQRDILPNVTTLIVPHSIALKPEVIEDWHRQGKRFVAEVGISGQAKSAEEHAQHWASYLDQAPFLDGILINEFIVNNPAVAPGQTLSEERQKKLEQERQRYREYEAALQQLHDEARDRDKTIYAYFGGSGKKLNQEVIGPTFVHTLLECGDRIVLERYLHEMSSEEKSQAALQAFVDGVADWETREPGAKQQMVIAFGLFSMPPGGINKQPNVDYHVWMDQQMHRVANDPQLAGIGGLEWWTTILADEETVRFVGKLYRHYALEGNRTLLTHDPLFLPHVRNADFEQGVKDWELRPAVPESIAAKSFPRYGRIEGRYMGLGRPADPEHIGDTFLWMKRNEREPNSFSQTIKHLQPGRLYSMKMFSCDYRDLIEPKSKKQEEALPFLGQVTLEGVEIDPRRSFNEMYPSNPEPPIPVWITYHWKVFRALEPTARLTVSDWPAESGSRPTFGQEQIFNFVEIQPYHE